MMLKPLNHNKKARNGQLWDAMYEKAKDYYKENGHINVPTGFTTLDGFKLGQWIAQQRRIIRGEVKHSISMDQERLDCLIELGVRV